MTEAAALKPFPPKRNKIRLQHIFDDTILDRPRAIPASRRPPLGEIKNNATSPNKRRRKGIGFEVFDEGKKAPTLPAAAAQEPIPKTCPQLPPATLTALLLSHASPHPKLPAIPTPPWTRLPRQTPLEAAQSLSVPAPPPVINSTPHLVRELRASLEALPPHHRAAPTRPPPALPPRKQQPQSLPPTEFALDLLPPLMHHSRHAIISLSPPSHLTLTLRGSPYTYRIAPSAPPLITVTDRPAATTHSYPLPELPYKHLPAFRYARRFVASVRRRTLVAYGGIGGAQGRVYADGHGVVMLDGGVEVAIGVDGEPTEEHCKEVMGKARCVYQWLLRHPSPRYEEKEKEEEGEWKLTEGTRFVRGVGWCREEGKGQWNMKFLDGVGLEIRAKSVVWIENGVRTVVREGLRDAEVREMVGEFVKAGL